MKFFSFFDYYYQSCCVINQNILYLSNVYKASNRIVNDITTQHNTTQHNTAQHNTIQHNTTQHNTAQHNTTQYNTAQKKTVVQDIPDLISLKPSTLRIFFLNSSNVLATS